MYSIFTTFLSIIRKITKLLLIWNILLFFPLFFILYQIQFTKNLIDQLFKFTQLDHTKNLFHSKIHLLQTWIFTIIKYILRIFKTKHFSFGYAVLKQNGKFLDLDHPNVFVYQLYNYAARKFLYLQSLSKKNILEIQCSQTGAIQYIASTLNPQKCIAINSKQHLIKQRTEKNANKKVIYKKGKIEQRKTIEQFGQIRFDCILYLNGLNQLQNISQKLVQMKKVLKEDGYICVGQYLDNSYIKYFQQLIIRSGMKITNSENISKNVIHAIKLLNKRELLETSYFQKIKNRFLSYFEDQNSQILRELQDKKKYIVYIVESNDHDQ